MVSRRLLRLCALCLAFYMFFSLAALFWTNHLSRRTADSNILEYFKLHEHRGGPPGQLAPPIPKKEPTPGISRSKFLVSNISESADVAAPSSDMKPIRPPPIRTVRTRRVRPNSIDGVSAAPTVSSAELDSDQFRTKPAQLKLTPHSLDAQLSGATKQAPERSRAELAQPSHAAAAERARPASGRPADTVHPQPVKTSDTIPPSRNTVAKGANANTADAQPRLKHILYWNEFYGSMVFEWGEGQQPFLDNKCEVNTCFGTNNRSMLPMQEYDAILFHVQTLPFLDWPRRRSSHQRYVFVTLESPQYKAIAMQFYNNAFNVTLTYRRDSDFPFMYGKFLPVIPPPPSIASKNYAQGKTKLVAWFVSHCRTHSHREAYVQALQQHIPVDVYGGCGNLTCARSGDNTCHSTLLDRQYKFYLSFENSLCADYVTEKLFDALQHSVLPVVWGGADYAAFAPPNSYIDATRLSPRQLAQLLRKLDADDNLYNEYFRWKGKYRLVDKEVYRRTSFCDLCKYLHGNSTKVYRDINKWWTNGQCKKLRVLN